MFKTLPDNAHKFMNWSWDQIQPYFQDLIDRRLGTDDVDQWLADWRSLGDLLVETHARLKLAIDQDTTNENAEAPSIPLHVVAHTLLSLNGTRFLQELFTDLLKDDHKNAYELMATCLYTTKLPNLVAEKKIKALKDFIEKQPEEHKKEITTLSQEISDKPFLIFHPSLSNNN